MDDILKTRGIIYSNVEIWLLLAPPPFQTFWLRASVPQCVGPCCFTATGAKNDFTVVDFSLCFPKASPGKGQGH